MTVSTVMNKPRHTSPAPKLDPREQHFQIAWENGLNIFLRFLAPASATPTAKIVLYVHGATFPSPLSIAHRFDGHFWRLVRWETHDRDGSVTFSLGEDAVGQIQYSEDGRMSAQWMGRNQLHFASGDWRRATVDAKAQAWGNYFGCFGTYAIDEQEEVVPHHIEGSWFPNLVAGTELRHYRFSGGQLVLDADTPWGRVSIIWGKIRSSK